MKFQVQVLDAEHGGTLRLKVQADDGAPREFATAVRPPPREVVPAPVPGTRPRNPAPAGTSVNVWDRLGGGKGSGRDDPTQ